MHGLNTIINTNKQVTEAKKIMDESKGKPDQLQKHLEDYLKIREENKNNKGV